MFKIQQAYLNAVNSWQVDENAEAPQTAVDFLVSKVAQSVLALQQLKPAYEKMAKTSLTPRTILYAVAQDKDRKEGSRIPERLKNVKPEERALLCRVITDLKPIYPEEAKEMVLLLGARHVQEALNHTPAKGSVDELMEEMEATIARLQTILATLPTTHPQYEALTRSLATARAAYMNLLEEL